MKSKRYFWLKLKEDFFDQKEIKRIRRLAGGDTFTIIYLKMLLLSLKTEGKIYFDGIGDDFIDELSLEIDEQVENIRLTISYLKSKGLLEVVNESEYYLNDIPAMIGSETDKAVMMRRLRSRQANQKQIEDTKNEPEKEEENEDISNDVTPTLPKCYTEKEKEIDKEIDKDKDVVVKIISFWDDNGFGFNNMMGKDSLLKWLDDSKFKKPDEMIIKALEIAAASNIRNLKYVEGILKNWQNESLLTLAEVEQKERGSKHAKSTGGNGEESNDNGLSVLIQR